MMKEFVLYILFLTGSFSVAHAQEDGGKKEQKIKALYVAYVTQQLNLSEAEAQKFWPIHAEFETEMKGVSIDMPELPRQQALLDIKKKYQDRFTNILGSARSNNFYRLDGEFRRKLIDEIRKRRQENNMNMRPGKRRN
ncbi:MAG: hypothetical protein ABI402_15630 [Ferruginibacter sp.]